MNLVVLIGNLTSDPDVRYSQNQMAIAKFTLAINRYVKDGDNQADFIRVTAFGKQGELVETYLKKGSKVAVEGRIQTGSYKDKDGKTVYTTDVIANKIEFVDKKKEQGFGGTEPTFGKNEPEGFTSFDKDSEKPPF